MSAPKPKPKLRWWQLSLRKLILLTTLFTVLAVAGHRLREWGRDSWIERMRLYAAHLHYYRESITQYDSLSEKNDKIDELWEEGPGKDFGRKRWLPMFVYYCTTSKEEFRQRVSDASN